MGFSADSSKLLLINPRSYMQKGRVSGMTTRNQVDADGGLVRIHPAILDAGEMVLDGVLTKRKGAAGESRGSKRDQHEEIDAVAPAILNIRSVG